MSKISEFFRKKGVSFYLIVASFIFILTTLIIYSMTGVTLFSLKLSPMVIVLCVISLAAAAVSMWREYQPVLFGIFLLMFWALFEFIISQAEYLAAMFTAIDTVTVTTAFILTVLFNSLAWLCALAAAIVFSIKKGNIIGETIYEKAT